MQLEFRRVNWPFALTFRIASRTRDLAETVWVELTDGGLTGRGEAMGVFYHDETIDSILAQLGSIRRELEKGISRIQLRGLLRPGGARNAIDCALWDLEAKRAGRRAWELAGFSSVKPLTTAYTLSIDTPVAMARLAASVPQYTVLKAKVSGEARDLECVTAVREARPDASLIVDANQSWQERHLRELTPRLAVLDVKLIEQPLPAERDAFLAGYQSPVPLCADESCQTVESLRALQGKYQYINIKLDKTGGLTEALRLARAALEAGFKLMVGCMAGSSLAMAPAFIVGQLCEVVDLDGPLLASSDVPHAIHYEGSRMSPPEAALWG